MLLAGFVGCAVMFGCGGGGGAGAGGGEGGLTGGCAVGAPLGVIEYSTVWGAGVPSVASQVLQVLDADGSAVRTEALNRQGANSSQKTVANVTPGIYELRVTLYSLENAGGVIIGVVSVVVELCGGAQSPAVVKTTSARQATKITVAPSQHTLSQQQRQRYIATPRAATNEAVFFPTGSITWSVLGGIGDVTTDGDFTAVNVGDGSVRAETSSPPLAGAGSVTVEEFIITTTKWTILVFLNAANNLAPDSEDDVNEMERVAANLDVRFIVQWKQSRDVTPGASFDGVRRYLIKPDTSPTIVSELLQSNLVDGQGNALDMGDPQVLNDFLVWAKTFYPADRYVLDIWNHGNGWRRSLDNRGGTRGFSYDDQYGSSIEIWQLDQALAGQHFDVLCWDASLMQMLEVAYEARTYADYIVGSEESPPAAGYPYDEVFDVFRDNPDDTTANLTKGFIDGMLNYEPYQFRAITQSSLDSSKLTALAVSMDTFAQEMILNRTTIATAVQNARANAQKYSPTSFRVFRDLVGVCLLLEADGSVPDSVKAAAADVRAKVADAIVWEGHNNEYSPGSNGVSIDFSSWEQFGPGSTDYRRLKFAQDTCWDEWLVIAP